MAIVRITKNLEKEINKRFRKESLKIIHHLYSLNENPTKGKELGAVGSSVIKEIKYKSFRFYFITKGHKLKILKAEELKDLLIKFVRMSNKKDQQKTINEIKIILRILGDEGFD
jgi:hypothetical protein